MSTSTEASNLVNVISFKSLAASSSEYSFSGSYFPSNAFLFFLSRTIVISLLSFLKILFESQSHPRGFSAHRNPHAASRACHHAHGRFYFKSIQIGHFYLRNFSYLIPRNSAYFHFIRLF